MKNAFCVLLLIVMSAVGFVSCSANDDKMDEEDLKIVSSWNLINVSGGIAGVNQNFDKNEILWDFDEDSQKLEVVNLSAEGEIYDGLESGIYDYSILEVDGDFYLMIDGIEFSGYFETENSLILDQNKMSTGTGADGFILKFNR